MKVIQCKGINQFLIKGSRLLLENGIARNVEGNKCWEFPEPVCFKFTIPSSRWIVIRARKWNIYLAYAESLWIASGRNDLEMIGHYLKRMTDFSDDGQTLRGGYGPRIRAYDNKVTDYSIRSLAPSVLGTEHTTIDQLRFVVKCFEEDVNTRKAVIQIGDPIKDCFDCSHKKKETKDFPCTRTLHFMKDAHTNRLNLIVHMRSNDMLWGASGVNIFNFTFIQDCVARIIGLELGCYYHIADNFHYYDKCRSKIEAISKSELNDEPNYDYDVSFSSLSDFNARIVDLAKWEESIRKGNTFDLIDFRDEFFNDWAKIFYRFHTKKLIKFENPILNQIMN